MNVAVTSMVAAGPNGDQTTDMCLTGNGMCGGLTVLFDTGFALGAASRTILEGWFAALKMALGASCQIQEGNRIQNIETLELECNISMDGWPTIQFDIGGTHLSMKPEHYVTKRSAKTAFIMQIDDMNQMVIFGAAYGFSAFHLKFDVASNRLGFQVPKGELAPTPSPPAPVPSPECFPGGSTVQAPSQEHVAMESLRAGENILVSHQDFGMTHEAVYGFLHSVHTASELGDAPMVNRIST
jgi:hypothetical protein